MEVLSLTLSFILLQRTCLYLCTWVLYTSCSFRPAATLSLIRSGMGGLIGPGMNSMSRSVVFGAIIGYPSCSNGHVIYPFLLLSALSLVICPTLTWQTIWAASNVWTPALSSDPKDTLSPVSVIHSPSFKKPFNYQLALTIFGLL